LRAVGSRTEQTVNCYVLISNEGANASSWITFSNMIDENGDSYKGDEIFNLSFPTSVPVKVVYKYKEILPSVKYIKYIQISAGELKSEPTVEFHNVPISWE
jgi:hypothetical protein